MPAVSALKWVLTSSRQPTAVIRKAGEKIVEQTYAPIVVLGGGKSKDPADLLTSIYDAVNAGAAGVAVGRNIYRHPHPDKLTAAIVAIVHEDATVEKALEYLK